MLRKASRQEAADNAGLRDAGGLHNLGDRKVNVRRDGGAQIYPLLGLRATLALKHEETLRRIGGVPLESTLDTECPECRTRAGRFHRGSIDLMSSRNYDDIPTEFGGLRDNSRNPTTGRPTPRTASELAREMRQEGVREATGRTRSGR